MNIKNTGKPFEAQIQRWLKNAGYYYERFYDSRSVGGITQQRPADFFVYHKSKLFYIECKSTITSTIYIQNFHQIPRLLNILKYNIDSYFFIKFGDKTIIAITTQELNKYFKTEPYRSLSLKTLNEKKYKYIIIKKLKDLKEVFEI